MAPNFPKLAFMANFGLTTSTDFRPSNNCSNVAKKANKLVHSIGKKKFTTNQKKLSLHYLMHLYVSI